MTIVHIFALLHHQNGQDDVMNDNVFDYGLYLLEGILEQLGRHLTEFPANEPPLCPAPIYAIL